jgi:oligogalacturonide lyase
LFSMSSFGLRAAAQTGHVFPRDWIKYSDPATEFQVYRLTDSGYSSYLPSCYAGAIAHRNNFLVFCCDRTGSLQAFRLDLKNGESRLLTEAKALDASSLRLAPGDRGFYYFDGPSLRYLTFSGREREVYRVPEGFSHGAGFSISIDGRYAVVPESKAGGGSRLRLIQLAKGAVSTLVDVSGEISDPMARPKRDSALYRRDGDSLWLVNFDRQQNRRLKIAEGVLGPALWAPDGKTVLYLNYAAEKKQLNSIREHVPDTSTDKLVSPTSQFVSFAPNSDASVFVGASASKASPFVLLLVRMTQREMTMCEHKASEPEKVAPIFSPDSQRIFFQSDRHGKQAIYMMGIEKLVEKTV